MSCSSNKTEVSGNTTHQTVNQLNRALYDISYSPDGKGFAFASSDLPEKSALQWASNNKNSFLAILQKIPADYILQVTGHTDNVEHNHKNRNYFSEERAINIFNILKRQGIPTTKLRYKGIGSEVTTSLCYNHDPCQRRVSFQVVLKYDQTTLNKNDIVEEEVPLIIGSVFSVTGRNVILLRNHKRSDKVGVEFIVFKNNQAIAKVRVTQVTHTNLQAVIISGSSIEKGLKYGFLKKVRV